MSTSTANPLITTPENKRITSASSSASRFLYRGALSLPDSLLTLDGLTFTAHLGASDRSASKSKLDTNLLQNPLALALQTMRGRPSLRLLGTLKLRDVYLDDTGGVEMFVALPRTHSKKLTTLQLQGYSSYGRPLENLL
jgi:hypothetical protein